MVDNIHAKFSLLKKIIQFNQAATVKFSEFKLDKFELLFERCKVNLNRKVKKTSNPVKKSRKFKCSAKRCNKQFTMKHNLVRHVNEFHSNKVYECPKCFVEYTSLRYLKRHKVPKYDDKDVVCIESGCKRLFRTPCLLRRHFNRVHMSSSGLICTVEGCDRSFKRHDDLSKHLKIKHNIKDKTCKDNTKFKCTIDDCKVWFTNGAELRRHIDRHQKNKKFKCEHRDCEEGFVTKWELNRHVMRHHNRKKPFKCKLEDCGKRFTTSGELKSHQSRRH